MRYVTNLIGYENASALRLCCRLENPFFVRLHLHRLLQILILIRKDESRWQEHEVFETVDLSQLRNRFVHQVLPCDVERAWKVVYLLVSVQILVGRILNGADVPNDGRVWLARCCVEAATWPCRAYSSLHRSCTVILRLVWHFAETVVFQGVPNNFNVAVSQIKIIAPVWRLIRPYLYRIFIHSEHKVLLPDLIVDLNNWSIFEKHRRKLCRPRLSCLLLR